MSSPSVEPRPGGQASAVFVFAVVIGLARAYWSRKSYLLSLPPPLQETLNRHQLRCSPSTDSRTWKPE